MQINGTNVSALPKISAITIETKRVRYVKCIVLRINRELPEYWFA